MKINQASNADDLKMMLKYPLKCAVRIVMEKILAANEDAINKVVYYGVSGTPRYYQNTYEFLDAWDIAVHSSKAIKTADVQGSFFYKPSEMSAVPPNESNNYMGQHYGVNEEWGDARKYLAEIIYEGEAGPAYGYGPWQRKRNAYKELIKIIGKDKMRNWMAEAMEEVGLNVKVHRTAIKRTEFE